MSNHKHANGTALAAAILLLRQGQPLPTDMVAALLNDGIDVAALEVDYTPEWKAPPTDWFEFMGSRSTWPRPDPHSPPDYGPDLDEPLDPNAL